jgi:hypothetical protein
MSNGAASVVGWITVVVSLIVGLLGAAPFTPAILLVAILLPIAAIVTWRGATVAGGLSLLLCIAALAVSPVNMADLLNWPLSVAWLGLCSCAVLWGIVHNGHGGNRPSG